MDEKSCYEFDDIAKNKGCADDQINILRMILDKMAEKDYQTPLILSLSSSNWAVTCWIVWRQVLRSAAGSDYCLWSMLQVLSDFFRLSLNLFLGAPLSRCPVESSPNMTILGRRWSSIRET